MNVCPCSYMQDGAYHPQLSLPPQVKDLDPAWKNCNMAFWGAWDPPMSVFPLAFLNERFFHICTANVRAAHSRRLQLRPNLHHTMNPFLQYQHLHRLLLQLLNLLLHHTNQVQRILHPCIIHKAQARHHRSILRQAQRHLALPHRKFLMLTR